ncbi:hypothetical protein Lsai_2109 [Legionella sainthelensi]|uniref:Uncharacterized protein n=2 Tax=Legionella sainthelensi TaxID=28087 RepID=A0A0W0YGK9_9GAMM|nr:hypothetical protein Lsai_2109 [Legionella sainthelensi]VEH28952.1 Uncharacterised protein [Legionella sainthelensi]
MYNDFKIQYKDKIQMYIQAGGGPTLYLNENLFFPLSGYSFSRDNYWSQYKAIYKPSRLDFNLHQDFDSYPKFCIEYGFVSKQKKWTLEETIHLQTQRSLIEPMRNVRPYNVTLHKKRLI